MFGSKVREWLCTMIQGSNLGLRLELAVSTITQDCMFMKLP